MVYCSPNRPDDVAAGNWIQTDLEKGWFVILRHYSPLAAFFDKTWRAGEVELGNAIVALAAAVSRS